VLAKPGVLDMVAHLRKTARDERLSLFQRFSIMRHWVEVEGIAFTELLSPDGLHMNDWSYGCVAKLLGEAIGNAVRRPTVARAPRH
jgi:hypothetical protein